MNFQHFTQYLQQIDPPPPFTTHSPTNTEAINLYGDHRATYIPHITYTDKDSLFIDDITPDETKQPPLSTPRYGQAYKDKEHTTPHYYTKIQTKLQNMEMK